MEYVLVFGYFHTEPFQPYIYDFGLVGGGGGRGKKDYIRMFKHLKKKQFSFFNSECGLNRYLVKAIQKTHKVGIYALQS
jgi:hypothetical protein